MGSLRALSLEIMHEISFVRDIISPIRIRMEKGKYAMGMTIPHFKK